MCVLIRFRVYNLKACFWVNVGWKKSDVRVWFALEHPSNVAVKPALTSRNGDEDKMGKQKRGSAALKGIELG